MRVARRTRRRILEAARTVFAEIGYERATIRGIAAAAGEAGVNNVIAFGAHEGAQFRLMDVRTDCEGSDVTAPAEKSGWRRLSWLA